MGFAAVIAIAREAKQSSLDRHVAPHLAMTARVEESTRESEH
jgi:hypothetical protein